MADKEPEAAGAVRGFYAAYWRRVRSSLWGEVDESVVPVLLGRFEHYVNLCPDGVLVVLRRSSTDGFSWSQRDRKVLDLARDVLDGTEAWEALGLEGFEPGPPTRLDFDLDVAARRDESGPSVFDRIQLRYVPFEKDYGFWTASNAERLAARNLEGPAE